MVKFSKFIFAFIYLIFTVLVNVQAVDACQASAVNTHMCCCSAASNCESTQMNCCVNAPEDESRHYDHIAFNGPEIAPLFTPAGIISLKTETVLDDILEKITPSESPPIPKVYLVFHKLLFYA